MAHADGAAHAAQQLNNSKPQIHKFTERFVWRCARKCLNPHPKPSRSSRNSRTLCKTTSVGRLLCPRPSIHSGSTGFGQASYKAFALPKGTTSSAVPCMKKTGH
mmetsp:Transcript_28774/g.66868  ORF Transcript_28774/g.66868 Transcript_28774/m.66868 type:complete len:104 (+) Transcript_28774:170-481(+)